VGLVADLRNGRSVAEAIEETHTRILKILGFDFLMHQVGCGCDVCQKQIGRVQRVPTLPPPNGDPVLARTHARAEELREQSPVEVLGLKGLVPGGRK